MPSTGTSKPKIVMYFTLLFVLMLTLLPFFHACLATRELQPSLSLSNSESVEETRTLTLGPKRFSHDKEVRGCLPKGLRRASAPSRFANYHTFGWTGCRSFTKKAMTMNMHRYYSCCT